ncbi:MAG: hydroxyacylglutathione hydrolase, partial [Pseudomonadota bacterium]
MMHHRGPITVHQFPCLSDNYGFLVRDEATGVVATIDTPDAKAIITEAESLGWTVNLVLNTHWHPDHAGGNREVADHFGAEIIAPLGEGDRIPEKDRQIADGDAVMVGETVFNVVEVPGHTLGHIAYIVPSALTAFVGDTLFSLGCGRLFEGTAEQMWTSLLKLRALPDETMIFCAHEYTSANAKFAVTIEPENQDLTRRAEEISKLRLIDQPTVPVLLGTEKKTNPFLRADIPSVKDALALASAADHEVFAEIRTRK